MTATLHLPPSVCMCAYVYVCVCEWECETGIEICAQGQSTDLPIFFFYFAVFCDFCFYFGKRAKIKSCAASFRCSLRKIYANCRRQCERREWEREIEKRTGGEESGAEAAATQIKSNFQFPELAKIEKFTAATRAHTHKHIYICTRRDKLKFVFRYLKIPRSCAQASRN